MFLQNKAERHVREAAQQGANIILLQELFQTPYFCQEQSAEYYKLSGPLNAGNSIIQKFSDLARKLEVVIPLSFFERSGQVFFNSVVIIDADGSLAGHYRKSHIPDGPGYQEKFYFSPGDTGFKAIPTKYGCIGVCICWDQWFPEAARACVLQGADILFYPSAIGSEPTDSTINSYPHWIRTMQGHAAANMVPVVASNRVGREVFGGSSITFYGGSFIAGYTGEIIVQVGGVPRHGSADPEPNKEVEGFVCATFDLEEVRKARAGWGLFRDRRPELYTPLCSLDGKRDHLFREKLWRDDGGVVL